MKQFIINLAVGALGGILGAVIVIAVMAIIN
jgi:hypothetical protein